MIDNANVVKGGETRIQVGIYRSSLGTSLNIKAIPDVEDFMRNQSGGETIEVNTFGRYWVPPDASKGVPGPPLRAYLVTLPETTFHVEGKLYSTLDRLGSPLFDFASPKGEMVNLSYLRLVGISEGSGVSFNIRGVYSLDQLRRIRDQITLGQRNFYRDYIRPVDLTTSLIVTSQGELQL